MVIAETISGLGALKTAMDMAKALKDINDATIRNSVVIDLQQKILSAQEGQIALLSRIDELEKEVAAFSRWEAEKKDYVLTEIFDKTFAYSIAESARGSQPYHLICANCFEGRRKSILQRADASHLFCPECKTRVRFDQPSRPSNTTRYNPHRGW